MNILKNPVLWIIVIVAATVILGYQVTVKTALQQAALKNNHSERLLTEHEYNLYSIAYTPPGNIWAVGSGGIILHSMDDGETWKERQLDGPEQVYSSICFPDENNGWVAGNRGTILHTEDGGTTWKKVDRLYSAKDKSCSSENLKIYFTKVFFKDVLHGWIVGESGTVLLTTDGGKYWQYIDTNQFFSTFNDVKFSDLKNGWVVGEMGLIMVTTDGGHTWANQESGVQTTLMSIEISPTDSNTLWVGGLEGTVLSSKDAGANWKQLTLRLGEDVIKNHVYKVYEKESGTRGLGHNHVYTLSRNSQQYSFDDGFGWRPFMMDSETETLLRRGWLYDMVFRLDSDSVLDKDISAGAVGESNYGWLVGKAGIVLRTVDSQNWKRVH